jgi:hypothetical protein
MMMFILWEEAQEEARSIRSGDVDPGHRDLPAQCAQRQYFVSLRAEVTKRKGLPPERVQADVPAIRTALLARHPTDIDAQAKSLSGFESQVAQVYREITGRV